MTDFMASTREWEKLQLAKLAVMASRWRQDPVGSIEQIPKDFSAAGRNIAAETVGFAGDVQPIAESFSPALRGRNRLPTSEELVAKWGDKEHWSHIPAMFVAPGPAEVKAGLLTAKASLKAMLGLAKESSVLSAAALMLFKGTDPTAKVVDDTFPLYEDLLQRQRVLIKGWKKQLEHTEPNTASHFDDSMRVDRMEKELAALEEAGEIPFTFYAARDDTAAQYFADQFKDGVVRRVDVEATNLATVDDVRGLKDKNGLPLNPNRRGTISHLNTQEVVALKKAGFDGAAGPIDNIPQGDEVVVFSPEQVKFVEKPEKSKLEKAIELVDKY